MTLITQGVGPATTKVMFFERDFSPLVLQMPPSLLKS